ncbi:hypothetical protein [Epibacterium ulvae]|uniref:hypothetical protein n=1 Tax=Epibacterium ulvae TaxID=1156985 RepID=UPI0024938690|nr:hypothetical protein [Epibacterium ulvae]
MTNTYAINVTRNKEFEVRDELRVMGLMPWVPTRLASRYIKEKRAYSWYDVAYVPKLMFCVIPAIYWRDVYELKHVIGKPARLLQIDIEGIPAHTKKCRDQCGGKIHVPARPGLLQFQQAVEAEYGDALRKRENAEYECKFTPGQALQILNGPFAGFTGVFQESVQQAYDEYSKLKLEVDVFGRGTPVIIDPDMVSAPS